MLGILLPAKSTLIQFPNKAMLEVGMFWIALNVMKSIHRRGTACGMFREQIWSCWVEMSCLHRLNIAFFFSQKEKWLWCRSLCKNWVLSFSVLGCQKVTAAAPLLVVYNNSYKARNCNHLPRPFVWVVYNKYLYQAFMSLLYLYVIEKILHKLICWTANFKSFRKYSVSSHPAFLVNSNRASVSSCFKSFQLFNMTKPAWSPNVFNC